MYVCVRGVERLQREREGGETTVDLLRLKKLDLSNIITSQESKIKKREKALETSTFNQPQALTRSHFLQQEQLSFQLAL